eukprot:3696303-Alexandrium_andersonii.AAC.1
MSARSMLVGACPRRAKRVLHRRREARRAAAQETSPSVPSTSAPKTTVELSPCLPLSEFTMSPGAAS